MSSLSVLDTCLCNECTQCMCMHVLCLHVLSVHVCSTHAAAQWSQGQHGEWTAVSGPGCPHLIEDQTEASMGGGLRPNPQGLFWGFPALQSTPESLGCVHSHKNIHIRHQELVEHAGPTHM